MSQCVRKPLTGVHRGLITQSPRASIPGAVRLIQSTC